MVMLCSTWSWLVSSIFTCWPAVTLSVFGWKAKLAMFTFSSPDPDPDPPEGLGLGGGRGARGGRRRRPRGTRAGIVRAAAREQHQRTDGGEAQHGRHGSSHPGISF